MHKNTALSSKVRDLRKSIDGGTLTAASARLGLSVRALGAYERDESLPDIDFLARLCELTGANISELITLRLQANGHDQMAQQVREPAGDYVIDKSTVASHARHAIMAAESLPQYWQLGIMELAAAGEITAAGVDRLIDMIGTQATGGKHGEAKH